MVKASAKCIFVLPQLGAMLSPTRLSQDPAVWAILLLAISVAVLVAPLPAIWVLRLVGLGVLVLWQTFRSVVARSGV